MDQARWVKQDALGECGLTQNSKYNALLQTRRAPVVQRVSHCPCPQGVASSNPSEWIVIFSSSDITVYK